MSMQEESGRDRGFTVKEILTDIVLPQLKSIDDKLDTKADAATVSEVRLRLETLERQFVTRDEKHKMQNEIDALKLVAATQSDVVDDIDGLKTWSNRLKGAVALMAAVLIPTLAYLASHLP